MEKNKSKKSNIMFWAVGSLFIITMLSLWLVCGLFARYATVASGSDSARVAKGGYIDIWEYDVTLNNGVYELDESKATTKSIKYDNVIPGVDIAKSPFITLDLDEAEVDYVLYVQVIKSDKFPDTVTFDLTDEWEVFDEDNGIYKYKYTFDAATAYEDKIKILKDDKLYVSEHYVGNNQEFSLTFKAWIKQVD